MEKKPEPPYDGNDNLDHHIMCVEDSIKLMESTQILYGRAGGITQERLLDAVDSLLEAVKEIRRRML